MNKLTNKLIKNFSKRFNKNTTNKVFKNINTKTNFRNLVIKADYIQSNQDKFTNQINIKTNITDQHNSGRCWLFAMLNVIRLKMIDKYKIENFELSENYLFFYDRLEKANYFFNIIAKNYKKDFINDLKIISILKDRTNDGNHWNMFSNLIKKYGIVPKDAMNDHFHSKNTRELNIFYNNFLSKMAQNIVISLRKNPNLDINKFINNILKDCYKILVIFLGEPPKKFDWEYYINNDAKDNTKDNAKDNTKDNTKDNLKLIKINNLTPLEFYKKYVNYNVNDKICLINYPCKEYKYYKSYTIDGIPNFVGAKNINYINVPQNIIEKAIIKSIDNNEAIWCGIDWGKFNTKDYSVLDQNAFNYKDIFGFNNEMEKCDGLTYRQSTATHAVVIRGYNKNNNNIIDKFKVENSHGNIFSEYKKFKYNGYYVMSNDWFNKYLYIAVVDKKHLDKKVLDCIKRKPTILPYYTPFGALMH